MYHLLSEMLLFHDSDTAMKSTSKKPNIFRHRSLMTMTGKMFKAGLSLRGHLLLGYCTHDVCDACCPRSPSSTQTTSHSQDSALQSGSASLPLLSSSDFLRSDTLMHSLEALLSPSTCTLGCEYPWGDRQAVGQLREFVPSSFALSWKSTSQIPGGKRME